MSANGKETPDSSSDDSYTRNTKSNAKLLRKIDYNVLPILSLLYLLSFLDRSNIGNAKIEGLTTDLKVVGANYNTALALFFVGYVVAEIPAQLVLKKLNPQIWLPTLAVAWSIVSVCQALVHNQNGLFAVRVFLGVSEAGLFPGCVFLFSMFYPRHLRHFRVALFFSGAALAGAFGGILAYGLSEMRGIGGKPGWFWIFMIEALITLVAAIVAYWFVPASITKSKFLSSGEKEHLVELLSEDSDVITESFNWDGVFQAFKDPYCWGYSMLFHCHAFVLYRFGSITLIPVVFLADVSSVYSISLFSPTIIAGLGFKTWQAQLLSTPPYALAFVVTMSLAWFSHKTKRRAPFIIGGDIDIIIGYILLIADTRAGPSYVGLFFVISGIYASNALVLSWPSENVSNQTKRATALGMQISIGNTGSITSVLIYRPSFSANHYRKAHIIAMCYIVAGACVALTLWLSLNRANKKRAALLAQRANDEKLASNSEEAKERRRLKGDRDVTYVYQI